MKTMLAMGTCFEVYGEQQLYRWLEHHAPHLKPWGVSKIGISNDGPWNLKADWISAADYSSPEFGPKPVRFQTWPVRLGRPDDWTYPGNWRNLYTIMVMAQADRFERVIYTEWDFFIYSPRMIYCIAGISEGIHTFWCPHFNCTEAAFMCIHKDHFSVVASVAHRMMGVEKVTDIRQTMEHAIPWTKAHQEFIGDRYSDYGATPPPNADYCAQLNISTGISQMLNKMMPSSNWIQLDELERAIAFKPED